MDRRAQVEREKKDAWDQKRREEEDEARRKEMEKMNAE